MSLAGAFSLTGGNFAPPPFPVHRFSVADYHRLRELGFLDEDHDVELLEGWIVPKMTRSPEHDRTIELVHAALSRILPNGWRIRVQSAITTADSEPEPDLAVVRGSIRDHVTRHPVPHEVGLIVEVAESTLARDRVEKGRLYALSSIPVYWIVNIPERQVEVYSAPSSNPPHASDTVRHDYVPGESVPFVLEGQSLAPVAAGDLFL